MKPCVRAQEQCVYLICGFVAFVRLVARAVFARLVLVLVAVKFAERPVYLFTMKTAQLVSFVVVVAVLAFKLIAHFVKVVSRDNKVFIQRFYFSVGLLSVSDYTPHSHLLNWRNTMTESNGA